MKRYKDGKVIEIPEVDAKRLKRRFEKVENKRPSIVNLEARVKALEEELAKIQSKLNVGTSNEA